MFFIFYLRVSVYQGTVNALQGAVPPAEQCACDLDQRIPTKRSIFRFGDIAEFEEDLLAEILGFTRRGVPTEKAVEVLVLFIEEQQDLLDFPGWSHVVVHAADVG
ncbi:MAG: hypothetical protein P8K80_02530 [Phycisphaerales bacterium]|nr:hypothetical protein [Phycisphaerales bacterium]